MTKRKLILWCLTCSSPITKAPISKKGSRSCCDAMLQHQNGRICHTNYKDRHIKNRPGTIACKFEVRKETVLNYSHSDLGE